MATNRGKGGRPASATRGWSCASASPAARSRACSRV